MDAIQKQPDSRSRTEIPETQLTFEVIAADPYQSI